MSLLEIFWVIELIDVETCLTVCGWFNSSRRQAIVARPIVTDATDPRLLLSWELPNILDFLDIVLKELHFIKDSDPSLHHNSFELYLSQIVHLWLLFFMDESIPGNSLHWLTLDHIFIIGVSLSLHCFFYNSKSPIVVQSLENLAHQFLVVLWSKVELCGLHDLLDPCLL